MGISIILKNKNNEIFYNNFSKFIKILNIGMIYR